MSIGIFLGIGESFADFKKKGQYSLILSYHLNNYSRNFDKVFVFSYAAESFQPLPNVIVIPCKYKLHRYFYSLLIPFFYADIIKSCSIVRGFQLTGGIPCFITKLLFGIPYIFNYGYDYKMFAHIEGKLHNALLSQVISWPIMALANKIIVTSRIIAAYLPQKFKTKIVYIPNGVDTTSFRPLFQRKKSVENVLFVGRLEKQKNLESLIEAVSKISNKKIILIFVGEGSLKKKVKN